MQITYGKMIDEEEALSFVEVAIKQGLQFWDIRWDSHSNRISVGLPSRISSERDFYDEVRMFCQPPPPVCPECGQHLPEVRHG